MNWTKMHISDEGCVEMNISIYAWCWLSMEMEMGVEMGMNYKAVGNNRNEN